MSILKKEAVPENTCQLCSFVIHKFSSERGMWIWKCVLYDAITQDGERLEQCRFDFPAGADMVVDSSQMADATRK